MITNTDKILVAGATGGVGQLVVAKLLAKDLTVRALTRSKSKAESMFDNRVEIVEGDIRYPGTLTQVTKDIKYIICCTGTTAFPSLRWDFANLFKPENSPEAVDGEGVKNLVAAAPQDLNRFVFVSSCGVLRQDQFPYNILNAFGVLDAKLTGEKAVQRGLGGPPAEPKAQVASSDASAQSAVQRLHQEAIATSGLPYTIIRPARLIDGPYTSYDLNTLLRAKTNGEKAVIIESGDRLNGETSRIDVANACVEVLFYESTINRDFSIVNSGNRITNTDWSRLFSTLS